MRDLQASSHVRSNHSTPRSCTATGTRPVSRTARESGSSSNSGSKARAHASKSSPVPTPRRRAHDLHVLLRHRLLRQPGGFEGFVWSGDVATATFPSRSPDQSTVLVDLDSRQRPCVLIRDDDLVTGVDQVLDFERMSSTLRQRRSTTPRDRLATSRAAPGSAASRRRPPDRRRVDQSPARRRVAAR